MPLPATSRFAERLAQTSPIWFAVWAGLAILTVALIVLMRTQWGQSRPMRKCAVLSLLAHVVLACFATTIKIVSSDSEGPTRPAMHVALVDSGPAPRDESAPPAGEFDPLPWDPRPSGPVVAPLVEPLTPPDLPELTAPPPIDPADKDTPESAAEDTSHPSDIEPIVDNRPVDDLHPELIETKAEIDNPPAPPEVIERPESPPPTEPETTASREEPMSAQNQSKVPDAGRPDAHRRLVDVVPDIPPPLPPVLSHSELASDTVKPVTAPIRRAADAVFRYRTASARHQIARRSGGSGKTEGAVDQALEWLARAQSPDGRWSASRHGAGREQAVHGHDRRGAGLRADTGITGLALLAFLGAGHTHRHGNHQEIVGAGLAFLVKSQGDDGNLAGRASLFAKTYCHAMATYALAEALAMTGDPALKTAVIRAAGYSIRSQHLESGGWRYLPGNSGDTSQLGWQVMALRSAERAGLTVPDVTWRGVDRFLQSVSFGPNGGLAAYRPGAGPSRTMTGEAAYCRQLVWSRTEIGGLRRRTDATAKGRADHEAAQYLMAELPGDGRDNLYYWYYATLFLHGRSDVARAGGTGQSDWIRWNDALKSKLIASQQTRGSLAGSWAPNTVWGGYGGRVYSTALAALCLEIYYRYADTEDRIAAHAGRIESPR